MRTDTATLAGTTILAAVVVVVDYAFKYSLLKIPFPWLPFLKFDFTGIPIVLSMLLFGLIPGAITSIVASVAILARSGDLVGSSMKGLAEFSTILGMAIGLRLFNRFRKPSASALGITSRVLIMMLTSLILIYAAVMVLPRNYADVPLIVTSLLGVFNIIQGAVSIAGGFFIYEAIRRRVPSLIRRSENKTGPRR